MHAAELVAVAAPEFRLVEDADEVDDDVAALELVLEPLFVMHVGADEPHRRQDLEIRVLRGVARQHLHVVAGCAEARHDLVADETRPAEDADLQ